VLYQHYVENPDNLDPETAELLMKLVTNQTTLEALNQQQLEQLDRATVGFAQTSPSSKTKETSSPPGNVANFESISSIEEPWVDPHLKVDPMQHRFQLEPLTDPVDIPTVPDKWWDQSNH
jgi:hypothetical protein